MRLACFWEGFEKESSAEATKGAPVPPLGGLTVLRIPSKKGKAGILDLGTRVGWRASRGGWTGGWVGGVGGGAREQCGSNNHPLRFLS